MSEERLTAAAAAAAIDRQPMGDVQTSDNTLKQFAFSEIGRRNHLMET